MSNYAPLSLTLKVPGLAQGRTCLLRAYGAADLSACPIPVSQVVGAMACLALTGMRQKSQRRSQSPVWAKLLGDIAETGVSRCAGTCPPRTPC